MSDAILVPLDGSELAEQALGLAAEVASRRGSEVHLVRVPVWPPGSPLAAEEEVEANLIRAAERLKGRVLGAVKAAVLPEEPAQEDTWPASAHSIAEHVLDYAGRHEVGLVVLATHGRGGLARAWFGSVAEALVRAATMPVLVFRPNETEATVEPLRHVLIPLDRTADSQAAIEPAARLAREFGARVTLLRVVPWPYQIYDSLTPVTVVSTGENLQVVREQAAQQLETLAGPLRGQGLEVSVEVIDHVSPGRAIVGYVEDQAVDLVALATHARKGFDRLILGSVADKVMRGAPCPVLLVRTGERESSHGA